MENAPYDDRFLAGIVDGLLVGFTTSILILPFSVLMVLAFGLAETHRECPAIYPLGTLMCSTSLDVNWFYIALLVLGMIFVAVTVAIYYHVIRPAKHNGQTFAKTWFKLKVINLDGTDSSMQTLFVRYFVWQLISMVIGAFVFITMFFDDNRRTLYDMVAKTKVVKLGVTQ